MITSVIAAFLENNRIPANAKFLLGISGGADSMALLHAFQTLHVDYEVMHCNFQLRGNESEGDELLVKEYCDKQHIPFISTRFNTREYALQKNISIEMAARELRFDWFDQIKRQKKGDYIVLAHQADDVAETVFINYCRGTGIKGLTGIKAISGYILRPLVNCSRENILAYIQKHRIPFHTDSTNQSDEYIRNLIRHHIIPVCKEINPSFLQTVRENCNILFETEQIYNDAIEKLKKECTVNQNNELLIDISKILTSPAPATLLFEILNPFGFNKIQTKDILNTHHAQAGKKFYSKTHILTKDRVYWRLYAEQTPAFDCVQIEKEGNYRIGDTDFELQIFDKPPHFIIPTTSSEACFDADKITFPLSIRHWQKGDFFYPLGMQKRRKKISDFFTDLKFNVKQKEETLIMLSGDDIMWIVNHRTDERFKITPSTQKVLQISVK